MFRRLSLQYKILIALTALPLLALSLYFALAINVFEEDKIAYVFDSSGATANSKSEQVRTDIQGLLNSAQTVLLTYSQSTNSLNESGQSFFNQAEGLVSLYFYRPKAEGSGYERFAALEKGSKKDSSPAVPDPALEKLLKEVQSNPIILQPALERNRVWLATKTSGNNNPNSSTILIGLFDAQDLQKVFSESGAQYSFLVGDSGAIYFSPMTADEQIVQWISSKIFEKALRSNLENAGTAELVDPSKNHLLVSYSKVGIGNLTVVSVVEKSFALKAVRLLIRRSLLFLVMLIAFTTLISVFASRGLTGALRDLLVATQKVTKGDFAVRVEMKNKDEIGELGESFNAMAGEVARLMVETAEKARMESELSTARTVQETLFPAPVANAGKIQVCGRIVPASECGGDWWYHFEVENSIWILLGDATGHGVPAALLTSAARAVASVIHRTPKIRPSTAMEILNSAIYDVSKGNMMMTFFLAVIDKSSGSMTYVNASHEPARILAKRDSPASANEFDLLGENNNPRLGEAANIQFSEATHQFNSGDRFVLFTDGILDVTNPKQKTLGERNFLKMLGLALHENSIPEKVVEGFTTKLEDYRSGVPLIDDVTLIVAKFDQ